MEEPEKIIEYLEAYLRPLPEGKGDMEGKRVLITAGPTYEKIDPVRFIGNYSSGKMGFALAEECARRGAEVTVIAGPVNSQISSQLSSVNCHLIHVESCDEMYRAATEAFPQMDAAILCAAVADYRPEHVAEQKIKREGDDLILRLVPNPDIAAALGKMKRPGQVLVGFALETNDEETNAKKKLEKKNLDFIVLNSLRHEGTCFQSDENQISIISKEGQRDYEKKSKQEVARDIVEELVRCLMDDVRRKR
jgi:phosphopantothenoylcysteine decarboxylase/phosphopantothenate--cysteine ligase